MLYWTSRKKTQNFLSLLSENRILSILNSKSKKKNNVFLLFY